jgi:ribonuclease P/MRP protein subunit RPP1
MKITDACVYPYPEGDSSVRRLALTAQSLGYDSIVAAGSPPCEYHGVTVLCGSVIQASSVKEVIAALKRVKGSGAVVTVQAGDNGFNRAVTGMKGVHILRGIHAADKRAFDHVAAKIAADNFTAIDLDLSPLVSLRGHARQKAIHRYLDLMVLYRRFEFPLTISSGARSLLAMRSVREVTGLCSVIGMDISDVELALAGVNRVTTPGETAVRVIA